MQVVSLKPTLYQAGLTFIVRDAVVKALCSIWSRSSVEGLNRERAGWGSLCPLLKQCLFYKTKSNGVNYSHSEVHKFPSIGVAHRHHGGDTDSHHCLLPVTRPLLRRSHRTPLHCSCPAVPSFPLSWPPDIQTPLFIHAHWTFVTFVQHIHILCQPLTREKTVNPSPSLLLLHNTKSTVDH